MLDLNTSVHFDEVELTVFVEELKSACTAVPDFAAAFSAALADLFNGAARNPDCRRLFDDLLVAALHRAVAFAEPNCIAEVVSQNLDLNMTRVLKELFQINGVVAESGFRFLLSGVDGVNQSSFGMNHFHTAAAATAGGFNDDGIADRAGNLNDFRRIVRQGAAGAGDAGNAGVDHGLFGGNLVAHQTNGFGARADKNKSAGFHAFCEICVFRKETVAGMNCFGIGNLGSADKRRHVQIALMNRGRSDANGLVCEANVLSIRICK